MRTLAVMTTLLMLPLATLADESQTRLKDGPGKDKVAIHCAVCHSTDYIPMNSPFLDRKGWEGVVNKMIKVMGASIPQQDVPELVEYLTRHYGKN